MRLLALPILMLCLNVCMAQAPSRTAPPEPVPASPGRTEPRVEKIHHEDSGSRIDELRVGGETRQITVQPKGGLPAYDVSPDSGTRAPGTVDREGTPGTRGWKLLGF